MEQMRNSMVGCARIKKASGTASSGTPTSAQFGAEEWRSAGNMAGGTSWTYQARGAAFQQHGTAPQLLAAACVRNGTVAGGRCQPWVRIVADDAQPGAFKRRAGVAATTLHKPAVQGRALIKPAEPSQLQSLNEPGAGQTGGQPPLSSCFRWRPPAWLVSVAEWLIQVCVHRLPSCCTVQH